MAPNQDIVLGIWATLLLSMTLLAAAAWAGTLEQPRRIDGVIEDVLGRPFANVKVELCGGKMAVRTKSGEDGRFSFTDLPAGTYALSAHRMDFKPAARTVTLRRATSKFAIYLETSQPLNMVMTTRRLD
jgi:hypothetical protein